MLSAAGASAQKRGKRPVKKASTAGSPAVQQTNIDAPAEAEPVPVSLKKNERPAQQEKPNARPTAEKPAASPADPPYYYEFSQPDFSVAKIVIRHDDTGKGTITFTKKSSDEEITDPLQVSAEAMSRIDAAYGALNFLDSNDNYQFERDYSHLGNATFRLKKGGKQRTVSFNWTQNKDAKLLMDEYRKLGNQYVWMFDITVARENQPLDAPRLMESLDSLVRRGEISDPRQMVPFLNGLANDERIPLIARNRAAKIVAQVEKSKK
jgi:hypothetical protein